MYIVASTYGHTSDIPLSFGGDIMEKVGLHPQEEVVRDLRNINLCRTTCSLGLLLLVDQKGVVLWQMERASRPACQELACNSCEVTI